MTNTPATVLRNAALIVESTDPRDRSNWTQGAYVSDNGQVCAVTSIELAAGAEKLIKTPFYGSFLSFGTGRLASRELSLEARRALMAVLRRRCLGIPVVIQIWNDSPWQNPARVARVMRKAAKRWERKHRKATREVEAKSDYELAALL